MFFWCFIVVADIFGYFKTATARYLEEGLHPEAGLEVFKLSY